MSVYNYLNYYYAMTLSILNNNNNYRYLYAIECNEYKYIDENLMAGRKSAGHIKCVYNLYTL